MVLLAALGLAGGVPGRDGGDAEVVIHLVRFGWHADVVVPAECRLLPETAPEWASSAHTISVGWGDARYFPDEDPGILTALRAAVFPTDSVLQVRAVNAPVTRVYEAYDILAFTISREGCLRLGAFIRDSFAEEDERLVVVPTNRETSAVYFLSNQRYHLFYNCNHWVAEALAAAGLRVRPATTLTVGILWRQVAAQGEIVGEGHAERP